MSLYHYTDLNAVHSILDTHKIRMTDIRFLNDKTEYLQGLKIVRDAANILCQEDSMYEGDFRSLLKECFKEAFNELFEFSDASEIFYVASFSRSSDTLSQWRSYGMFAIEFDKGYMQVAITNLIIDDIKRNNKPLNIEFIECHYVSDKNKAIQHAINLINVRIIDIMQNWWNKDPHLDNNLHLYGYLKETLSMLATTFKHPSFIEEKEVRLVVSAEIVSEKIKFRTKNNVLIPFYELEMIPSVITGVVIGPVEDQKVTAHSLSIFNSHRAIKLGGEHHLLSIKTSNIPYRML